MFIITAILTGFISFYLSMVFKKPLYFFLIFFADVILNIEVLSLFKGISGENIFLLTLIEFLICHFIWLKNKKPFLKPDFSFFKKLKTALMEDKSFFVLGVFFIFLIGVSFILASLSPVNEPDAQGYHALRALFWARDGFISHFEIADVRCHSMPINSELFYTWVLALFKNDTVFGLLQFFSYFVLIVSSYKIMGIYEIEFKKRLWAILIFSSFAGVVSQISSTQTDLCVGALLTLSLYLVLSYKKEFKLSNLYFASLAMALSFGVKSTGVIGNVPLIIWYIFILRREFIKFFILLVLNFVVFSSYNYVLNFINYGNFLGANSAVLGHGFWGGIKGGVANFIRYIFQFFDFSGFTIGFYLNEHLLKMQSAVISFFKIPIGTGENVGLNFTNISMTEQVLGFGILGFLVFLPASIIGFFKKKERIFSIIFWAQIFVLSFAIAYMIYSIRFLVTFVSVAIPLISITYFKKMNLYKFIVILFAIFYMGYASLFLSQRPLYYLKKEFNKTGDIKLIQNNMRDLNYKFYPSFNEAYTMKSAIEPYCKNGNKIGIIVSNGYMLYSSKFLEFNNDCKIETPNLLHIENNNLKDYDVLITQKDMTQNLETINKNDIKNPSYPNFKTICRYEGLDNNRHIRLYDYDEINKATGAICLLNKDYLEFEGYKETKEIEAVLPEYLKSRTNETVKDFIIWEKK